MKRMPSDFFPSSSAIRQIIPLAEKREALLKKIGDLEKKIAELNAVQATARRKPETHSVPREKVRAKPAPASEKKEDTTTKILALLKKAGAKGMTVREIASRLGTKMQNVHVWFSFKGRKLDSLHKVGQAQWVLKA